MRNIAFASMLLAVPSLLLAQEHIPSQTSASESPVSQTLASKAAMRQFQQDAGGDWIVKWHPATGTPGTIYGTGLKIQDWQKNSLEEARRHALQLLKDRAEMLGLGQSTFTEIIGARMGRTWSFTFDQSFNGVPALEGRVDVRINMAGVVSMIGSRAWPIPANFSTVPAINQNLAQASVWAKLSGEPLGNEPAPRLVIWGDMGSDRIAPFALAWEVVAHDNQAGTFGRYYVDANTNQVLAFESDKHDCAFAGCATGAKAPAPVGPSVSLVETGSSPLPTLTTVTVMAWTRTGDDAVSALQNVPLARVRVNVPGLGQQTTDANGQFVIDITSPVTITLSGGLDGVHHAPITGANAPSGSVTVNPGVNATLQLLSAGATTNQAAHTTASYWTDRTNVWARSILGNTSQLNTASNVGIQVNIASTCNAFYTGNTTNYYQTGGGCNNTAFSTVIAHEWGHGLDERYGGISNSNAEGLSEGWGDIIGMYQVDSPALGSGFQTPGVGLRDGNNTRVWPYSSGSPHGAGQVWMGWAWKFREALRASLGTPAAITLSDFLVLGTIVADATTRENAVLEVFIADDDDGNLLNGTPHYAELESASIQKGIPYPEVALIDLTHQPLGNTGERLTPREVFAFATPVSGSITQMRIVYNTGGGAVTRNMHPTATNNQWLAMLPGLDSGSVTYRVEAVHNSGTVVRRPETGDYSYNIDSGNFSTFFTEGFEGTAPGWTSMQIATQNDWQIGVPQGKSGTSQGVAWADPAAAAVGTRAYGNDLGIGNFNGSYQPNVSNYLRSASIDCTGRTGVRIRFRRWLTIEEGIFDEASLYCNNQLVWENPQNGNLIDTSWQTVEYFVPWADNNPNVQFEWRLITDGGLNLGGWAIDEVEVGETVAVSSDAELRFTPEQVVQGGAMNIQIDTPSNSRPYLLAIGDSIGPTIVPGFPIVFVGGNYAVAGGSTDASGSDNYALSAPSVPSAIGIRFYSQVLTVNQAFTDFVVSNRSINLITQTP